MTGERYYYHADHQGSITHLTNEDGNIVETFTYDHAYGTILEHNKEEETYNPYCYTAREYDSHDLYYYRARYYDPTIGRFISNDPIEFLAGDFNFYRYVGNDPVNFVDPSGLAAAAAPIAEGILAWIATDTAVPDPSDAAWPKWVAYAVVGGLAAWSISSDEADTTGDGGLIVAGSSTTTGAPMPPPEDPDDEDLPPAKKKANSSKPGEKVRTPDTAKEGDFTKIRGGNYKNNKTGEIWSKSHTQHSGGSEWKVGLGKGKVPTSTKKITVVAGRGKDAGKIIKVDK